MWQRSLFAVLFCSAAHDLRGSLRRPRPRPEAEGRLSDSGSPALGCATPDPRPQPTWNRHRLTLYSDCGTGPVVAVPASLPRDGIEGGPTQDHEVEHCLCRANAGREGDAGRVSENAEARSPGGSDRESDAGAGRITNPSNRVDG